MVEVEVEVEVQITTPPIVLISSTGLKKEKMERQLGILEMQEMLQEKELYRGRDGERVQRVDFILCLFAVEELIMYSHQMPPRTRN